MGDRNNQNNDGTFWYGGEEDELSEDALVNESPIDLRAARNTFSRSPTNGPYGVGTDSDYEAEIARVSKETKKTKKRGRRKIHQDSEEDADESIRPGAMSPISVKEAREKYLLEASSPNKMDVTPARERKSLKERKRFSSAELEADDYSDEDSIDWDDLIDSRYTPLIIDLADWIGYITGRKISWEKFFQKLWNGTILCELCNSINKLTRDPKSKKIHIAKHTTKGRTFVRYNVEVFILWCKEFGVPDISLMDVSDLVEKKSVKMVLNTCLAVGREMRARSLSCPIIAVLEQTYRMSYDSMIDYLVDDKPLEDQEEIRDSTLQRKKRFQLIKAKAQTGSQITEPSFDDARSNIQEDILCLMYMKGFKKGDHNAENVIQGWQGAVRMGDYRSKTLPISFKDKKNMMERIEMRYGQTLPRSYGIARDVDEEDGIEDEGGEDIIEDLKRYKTPDLQYEPEPQVYEDRPDTTDYAMTDDREIGPGYEEEEEVVKKDKKAKKKSKKSKEYHDDIESSDIGKSPKSKKKKKWYSKKEKGIKSESDGEKRKLSFSLGGGKKKKSKKYSKQEEQAIYQNTQPYQDDPVEQPIYQNTIEQPIEDEKPIEDEQLVYQNIQEYKEEEVEDITIEQVVIPEPEPESNSFWPSMNMNINMFGGDDGKKKDEEGNSWFPKIPLFGEEDKKDSSDEGKGNKKKKRSSSSSTSSSSSSSNDDSDERQRKRSKRRKKQIGGEYVLTIPPEQFTLFQESGVFGTMVTDYTTTENGDYKVSLTAEQYDGFQKSLSGGLEGPDQTDSVKEDGYYMVLFTPNQWDKLHKEEDFLKLDLSFEKNNEGKYVVHMKEAEYQSYLVIQQALEQAHAEELAREDALLEEQYRAEEEIVPDKRSKKKRKHKKKGKENNNRDSMDVDDEAVSPAFQEPQPDWFEQRRLENEDNKRNSSEIEQQVVVPILTPRSKRKPVLKRWLSNSKVSRDTSESELEGEEEKKLKKKSSFFRSKSKKTSDSETDGTGKAKKRRSLFGRKKNKPINANPPLDAASRDEIQVSDHGEPDEEFGQWPNIKTRLGVNDDPSYSESVKNEQEEEAEVRGKKGSSGRRSRSPDEKDRAKSPTKIVPEYIPPTYRPASRTRNKSDPGYDKEDSINKIEDSDDAFTDSSEYSIVSYPIIGRRKRPKKKRRRRPTGTSFNSDVGCMDCIIAVLCPWRLARAS